MNDKTIHRVPIFRNTTTRQHGIGPVYTVTKKKPKLPKFPHDEDISFWLKTNAPLTFEQLVDIRCALYHKCSRQAYVVTKKSDGLHVRRS
jgi:hypothetical protein